MKPTNTYPTMHSRARKYYMEQDAKDVAIDHAATKQAKADQAKAASNEKAVEAPWTSSKGQESNVASVTSDQRRDGLKMWKDLLIQTKDYRPFQQRSQEENLKEVKILRTAMSDFRNFRLCGMDSLRATHSAFSGLQAKYSIPG